jgi:hypothetical protein
MPRRARADHAAVREGRGSPTYQLHWLYGDLTVRVTVIGADAATAEDAADLLTHLLAGWDLDDPGSELSSLWQLGGTRRVDDRTLLLLHLTTPAKVDLPEGTATLSPSTPRPDRDLVRALAVDMVTQDLLDNGAVGAYVGAGTQVRVSGAAPTGDGWPVPVDGPEEPGGLRLRDGALVTVWRPGGEDPLAVTAVMATAWQATVTALRAVELRVGGALEYLGTSGAPVARLHCADQVVDVGDWSALRPVDHGGIADAWPVT